MTRIGARVFDVLAVGGGNVAPSNTAAQAHIVPMMTLRKAMAK